MKESKDSDINPVQCCKIINPTFITWLIGVLMRSSIFFGSFVISNGLQSFPGRSRFIHQNNWVVMIWNCWRLKKQASSCQEKGKTTDVDGSMMCCKLMSLIFCICVFLNKANLFKSGRNATCMALRSSMVASTAGLRPSRLACHVMVDQRVKNDGATDRCRCSWTITNTIAWRWGGQAFDLFCGICINI